MQFLFRASAKFSAKIPSTLIAVYSLTREFAVRYLVHGPHPSSGESHKSTCLAGPGRL
jgi:hypothetical protein